MQGKLKYIGNDEEDVNGCLFISLENYLVLKLKQIKVLGFGLSLGVLITEKPRFLFKKLLMDFCYCLIIRYHFAIIPFMFYICIIAFLL